MRKFFLFVAAFVFSVALVSCQKSPEGQDVTPDTPTPVDPEDGLETVTFTAEAESTRATLDGLTVKWETTDHIAVYDGSGRRDFSVKSVSGTTAVFEGRVIKGATSFTAVYPYSASSATLPTSGGVISLAYPSTQTVSGGSVAANALVAVATAGSDKTFNFKNVASLLKITVPANVTSVTLRGNAHEKIAGTTTCAVGEAPAAGNATSITLKPSGSTFVAGTYYIGILPSSLDGGFTLSYATSSQRAFARTTDAVTFPMNGGKDATSSTTSMEWIGQPIMNQKDLKDFVRYTDYFTAEDFVLLGADVNLTEAWTPFPLYCQFNMQNHKISGLNVSATNRAGFISVLDGDATLMNGEFDGSITLTGTGTLSYAGVVAEAKGTILQVTNRASVSLGTSATCQSYIGGLAGFLTEGGSILNSHNYGAVTLAGTSSAASWVGGLAGYMSSNSGPVSNSSNDGAVICSNSNGQGIGGIVGMMQGGGVAGAVNNGTITVSNSYDGNSFAAGIVGYVQNRSGKSLTVSSSTNNGGISMQSTRIKGVAGIVGQIHLWQNGNTDIIGCYNKHALSVGVQVASERMLAGIVASSSNTDNNFTNTISDCHNTTDIAFTGGFTSSSQTLVAGIVGAAFQNFRIQNCTNKGAVSSNWHSINSVSGILARGQGTTSVSGCTNEGAITLAPEFTATAESWQGGAAGIYAYDRSQGDVTDNTNKGAVSMSIYAGSPSTQCGGIIALAETVAVITVGGNVNRGAVTMTTTQAENAVGGVIGQVKAALNTNQNYNFGTIKTVRVNADGSANPTTNDNFAFTGGVVGGFWLSNASCSMTNDRNVGSLVAPGRAGGIFGLAKFRCENFNLSLSGCRLGDFTIKGYIAGGYQDSLSIGANNYKAGLYSYVKVTSGYTVFSESGSSYISKSDAEAEVSGR